MKNYEQNHRYSKTSHKPGNTQTFAFSAEVESVDGRWYFLAKIQAESDECKQIATEIVSNFQKHFITPELEYSIEERFEYGLRAINSKIREIQKYYQGKKNRFQLDSSILFVNEEIVICSGCGVSGISLFSNSKIKPIYSPRHDSEFSELLSGAVEPSNAIITYSGDCDSLLVGLNELSEPKKIAQHIAAIHTENGILLIIYFSPKDILAPDARVKNMQFGSIFLALRKTMKERLQKKPKQIIKNTKTVENKPGSLEQSQKIIQKGTKSADELKSKTKHTSQNAWNTLWGKYINPNPRIAFFIVLFTIITGISIVIGYQIYNPRGRELLAIYSKIETSYSEGNKFAQEEKQPNSAISAFDETKKLINSLSSSDKNTLNSLLKDKNKPKIEDILRGIEITLDELKGISIVEPTLIHTAQAKDNFTFTGLLGSTLLLVDSEQGSLSRLDTQKNSILNNSKNELLREISTSATNETLSSLYGLSQTKLVQIKSDGTVSEQKTTSKTWPQGVDAFTVYANNLYFLSSSDAQIYKYPKLTSGFGAQTSALKKPDAANLSTATSIAVNGNVYIAKPDGSLVLYEQSIPREIRIKNLPNTEQATQIEFLDSGQTLVIYDAKNTSFSIIDLSSEGALFSRQLRLKDIAQISNFSVDKKNKVIYFASGNAVYSLKP